MSEDGVDDAIMIVGQPYISVIVLMVSAWYASRGAAPLKPLSRDRFRIALGTMVAFHLVTLIYFLSQVLFVDYTKAEACSEFLSARLNSFAKFATYLSAVTMVPIRFLFDRNVS